jgi:hypothetical protein
MVGVTGTEALMNIAGKMCCNSVAGVILHCSSSSYSLMKLMPYIAFPALKYCVTYVDFAFKIMTTTFIST